MQLLSEIYPKRVTLKNGKTVTLRPLQEGDVEMLYQFFLTSVSEEELMLLKHNVKDRFLIESWCKNLSYSRVLPLVAITDEGNIIGEATLHRTDFGWSSRIAKLRCVTCNRCRGMGLGKTMFSELLMIARHEGKEKVWGEVLSSQLAPASVLKQLGFERVAVIPGLAKDLYGVAHDLWIYIYDFTKEEAMKQAHEDAY